MKAEFLMIGGFLGAGKTTAMLQLARHLTGQGRRVGLITNDQSRGLADTALAVAQGFPVAEVTGGCFCCRFDSLREAAERLEREAAPNVFLAEPVGSCMDLRATVQYPLRRLHGERYRVGPLTVVMDPARALRVLGLEPGKAFSPKVQYVYDKQLEEADILAVNKSDVVEGTRLDRLEAALRERYPRAAVLRMSARRGTGLEAWFEMLQLEGADRAAPEVDYDLYAEGEARLGWLNATVRLSGANRFDGDGLLLELAERIRARLEGIEIAHLKITLVPADGSGRIGVVNVAGGAAELSERLECGVAAGEMLVNLRAEAAPEVLREAVTGALGPGEVVRIECFRPGRPVPAHRMG